MNLNVNEQTRAKAIKCHKCFECLYSQDNICKVLDDIDKKVLFVEEKERGFCKFAINFGGQVICNCPVRKDIFENYDI
jgi:hypothetical protein